MKAGYAFNPWSGTNMYKKKNDWRENLLWCVNQIDRYEWPVSPVALCALCGESP